MLLCCSGVSRVMVRPFAGSFSSSWMTQAGGLDRGGVVRIAYIILLLLLSCIYIYIVIVYPHDVCAARDPYAAARPKRTFEFRFQRARPGQKTENGVRPVHNIIHNLLAHIIIIIIYVPRRAPSQRKGFRRCSTARIYMRIYIYIYIYMVVPHRDVCFYNFFLFTDIVQRPPVTACREGTRGRGSAAVTSDCTHTHTNHERSDMISWPYLRSEPSRKIQTKRYLRTTTILQQANKSHLESGHRFYIITYTIHAFTCVSLSGGVFRFDVFHYFLRLFLHFLLYARTHIRRSLYYILYYNNIRYRLSSAETADKPLRRMLIILLYKLYIGQILRFSVSEQKRFISMRNKTSLRRSRAEDHFCKSMLKSL